MTIPLDAIHPDQTAHRWRSQFEWHVDLLPALMDAIVTETLPHIPVSRGGSRFDRPQISGGGVDQGDVFLSNFDTSRDADGIQPGGAVADARALWWAVVDYTRATAAWIGEQPPALPDRPDADPLIARGIALTTAGWLIDHAEQIHPVTELTEAQDALFVDIRRLRGRYGVHAHPRTPRARCTLCGERAVIATWVDDPNGSPKPIRVAKCKRCGETYREET